MLFDPKHGPPDVSDSIPPKSAEDTLRYACLLTVEEAARYLATSVGTLRIWNARNIGPARIRLPGVDTAAPNRRMLTYSLHDLNVFIAAHRIAAGRLPRQRGNTLYRKGRKPTVTAENSEK